MTKSLSFKKTSLALAVALSLPLISAQAAESYKAEDVVVTASRVEQQLADVNMSVSVITNDQIEKKCWSPNNRRFVRKFSTWCSYY